MERSVLNRRTRKKHTAPSYARRNNNNIGENNNNVVYESTVIEPPSNIGGAEGNDTEKMGKQPKQGQTNITAAHGVCSLCR